MKTHKFKLLILILTGSLLISASPVLAQTEDTDDPQSNPAATEALKDRVEKVVQEKKSLENNGETKRGFVGLIERVSEETITIRNTKGTQIIPLTNQVELIKNDKLIEVKNIEIDDSAIILGIQTKENFSPVKIIFSETDLQPKPQLVLVGALTSLGSSEITLECRREAKEHQIILGSQTKYEDLTAEPILKSSLFKDMQVIIAGHIEINEAKDTETKTAKIIRSLVEVE